MKSDFSSSSTIVATVLCLLLIFRTTNCHSSTLLITNTRGDIPISEYHDGTFSAYLPELDLVAPDHMLLYDEYLFVSSGNTYNNSAIARINTLDGTYDNLFAASMDLLRPYGFAVDGDILWVASFLTDKILLFDIETGEYLAEFASGDGTEEGLCNGPNQIAIWNGKLYLTTQGSVAVDGIPQFGLPSQVVEYDLETGDGQVFIPQPEPLADGLGFVSMLGIVIDCDANITNSSLGCTMYTTDFGGGLRAYDMETQELIYAVGTTINGSSTGSLTLSVDGSKIIVPIFSDETSGSLLQFDKLTGAPMGSMLDDGTMSPVLVGPTTDLARPVGVLIYHEDEDEDVDGGTPTEMTPDSPTPMPSDSGSFTTAPPTPLPTDSGSFATVTSVHSTFGMVLAGLWVVLCVV